MQLKRPSILHVECRQRPEFSLENLLSGGAGVVTTSEWVALAPHLGHEVILQLSDLAVFETFEGETIAREELDARFGQGCIDGLVESGLLIGDHAAHRALRERDEVISQTSWWPPAAVAQVFGRWQGVDVADEETRLGKRTLQKMIDQHGAPPLECLAFASELEWLRLPVPEPTPLDNLLAARSTCRNFDAQFELPHADLSSLLHRVFGAQSSQTLGEGSVALKKNSPSGGGLHPVEAFVLVQRVAGMAPGLFHYHCVAHALEPVRMMSPPQAAEAAREFVAGQAWFSDAPVMVVLVARFQRNFWKYRNHAKAWRVIQLDAGHLSQNVYLTATEMRYGAFITGAINDECVERNLGLDGLSMAPIAIMGFGKRSDVLMTREFDPLGKVPH